MFVPPLLISILLYALGNLNLGRSWKQNFYQLFIPYRSFATQSQLTITNWRPFINLSQQQKIINLTLENQNLLSQVQQLQDQIKIDQISSVYSSDRYHHTPVRVVAISPTIVVTTPNWNTIKPGQPLVDQKQLLGLVENVTPPVINILPLAHPSTRLPIKLELGGSGLLTFQNHRLQITNIDNQVEIKPGSHVFTESAANMPANLYIGQIDQVISLPSDTSQRATIKTDYQLTTSNQTAILDLNAN